MRKVALVTGGSGRVGRALIDLLLLNGYAVRSLDLLPPTPPLPQKDFAFFQGSVTSLSVIEEAARGVHVIFHAASKIDLAPSCSKELWEVNVTGTANMVATCLKFDIDCLVYTSTLDVTWDWRGLQGPETQKYPSKPANGYIKTKIAAEKMVLAANGRLTTNKKILRTVALRPVHIYGPGDLLVLNALDIAKSTGYVPSYGTGGADFIYVKNVAHGHVLAAEKLLASSNALADVDEADGVSGEIFYLKDDYRTSYVEAFYTFSKMKYPAVQKFHVPYWIMVVASLLATLIYKIIFALGFKPEYKFSYWHVVLTSGTENVSAKKSERNLGYFQLVSTAQGLAETREWIKGLPP